MNLKFIGESFKLKKKNEILVKIIMTRNSNYLI